MTRTVSQLVLLALFGLSCTEATTELIPARAPSSLRDAEPGPEDAAPSDGAGELDAMSGPLQPGPPSCRGPFPCQCNNGLDEDGDGLIDGLDPECTGPFDNDESSFATGLPAENDSLCQDCFWDHNAGTGNDGCAYHVDCLFGGTPTDEVDACGTTCEVSARCISTCGERTPNGCDCFGCCEVTKDDGAVINVLLSETCSIDQLDDPRRCPRCVPNPTCRNPCGRCELCPGRRAEDLPADCPRQGACEEGQLVCSSDALCPVDFYCLLGCCHYVVQ